MPLLPAKFLQEIKKIISFGAIGVVNAVVDYGVFTFLIWFIFKNETAQNIVLANIGAWAVAVSGSYVMNALITFRAESGGALSFKKYLAFAAVGVLGLVANTLAVLGFKLFLPLLVAKFLAIGVSFVVNFSVTKFFVFKK
jgi:putative flippase GtrA